MPSITISSPTTVLNTQEYCTCSMKNICTVSNSSSKTIDSINDITQDLNQETAQVLSQEEQNKMFDASFLFPKSQHTALIQKHTKKISKKTVSTVKDQEQIFKV
jgi:hypothetical protein